MTIIEAFNKSKYITRKNYADTFFLFYDSVGNIFSGDGKSTHKYTLSVTELISDNWFPLQPCEQNDVYKYGARQFIKME